MAVDWSRIHASRARSAATLPLSLGSELYGLGLRLDRTLHRLRGPDRLPGLVVSVGGLTVGGAGKTPMTAAVAGWARDRGFRTAVLSRGYGRRGRDRVVTVSDGERVLKGADEAGDEPSMLASMLPGVPVVVAGRRSRAGEEARRAWDTELFVLDDGFQHWALERDLDLVLLDAADPVGNGRLLPRGPLREPVAGLERAHLAVLTRCAVPEEEAPEPADALLRRFPGLARIKSVHVPAGLHLPGRSLEKPPSSLRGRRVAAYCGIAAPGAFRETLAGLGAEVPAFRRFRDHHRYSRRDVKGLLGWFRRSGAELLLTTEKDWVRAGPLLAGEPDAGFLRVELAFPSGGGPLFDLLERAAMRKGLSC
jgi:tetraacyldisaccharide 4'-kinase